MQDLPDRRFVRLRLREEVHPSATMTVLISDPQAPPAIDNNGVLAKIAETDPARATRVQNGLLALIGREAELFAWMESTPENAFTFVEDPIGAIRAAIPDLPADFFAGWAETNS